MESDSCRQRPRIVSHVRASNREEQRCKSQNTIQTTLATKREQLNRPGQDSTVTLLTDSVFWIQSGKITFRRGSLELTLKEKRDQFNLPGQWTG